MHVLLVVTINREFISPVFRNVSGFRPNGSKFGTGPIFRVGEDDHRGIGVVHRRGGQLRLDKGTPTAEDTGFAVLVSVQSSEEMGLVGLVLVVQRR